MISFRHLMKLTPEVYLMSYMKYSDTSGLGSGAGKGGGAGGSIREAGGLLGEIGAAREEVYFRKQTSELIEKIKQQKLKEIQYHEEQMKLHEAEHDDPQYHKEQIERHKTAINRARIEYEEINSRKK